MSPPVRAVLLDALGTLVELQPPVPRLRAALRREGVEVSSEQAAAGIRAEIAYYLEHHLEGRDRASLEELRDRCAEELRRALGIPGLEHAVARRALLAALEFAPYPDALPALSALRERGLRLVVASNWDCSLPDRLERAGLLGLVDGVVTSAEAGAAKPAAEPFLRALELAGARPDEAVHIGDSVGNDIGGARAAGIRALLVVRDGDPPQGLEAIRSLEQAASLI